MPDTKENNNNNVNKRNIGATSPENVDSDKKLRKVMSETDDPKAFSWDMMIRKMDELLDRKLEKVATKADISSISKELSCLRVENAELKKEVNDLKESNQMLHSTVANQQKRLEMLDRKSKRSSVVISGLNGGSYSAIKTDIEDIFSNILQIEMQSFFCTRLNKEGTKCCVEMNSASDVQLVLKNSKKLKGTGKFIRKDLTAAEDKCGFFARNLKRSCMKKPNTNCRVAGASVIINGRQFLCMENGAISAKDEESASYLRSVLEEVNSSLYVFCPQGMEIADRPQ